MPRTRRIVQHHGGLKNCDIGMVTHFLNWMPMARFRPALVIGWPMKTCFCVALPPPSRVQGYIP